MFRNSSTKIKASGYNVVTFAVMLLCFAVAASFFVKALDAIESQRYQGALGCAECHKKEYEIWSKSKHALAFDVLPLEKRRDLTCLWCHATDARDNFKSFRLGGVQCEACHGKGAYYAYGTVSKDFVANHKKRLKKQTEVICLDCHSKERSPSVGPFDYKKKLEKIKHWD